MYLLAFGGSTDGRVAGLPSDAVEIEAQQSSVQAKACRGDGRFTSGMGHRRPRSHRTIQWGTGEAHGFIIRMFWVSRSRLVEWPSPLSPSAGVTRYVLSRSNRYGFC
jgi:hypothetical protein